MEQTIAASMLTCEATRPVVMLDLQLNQRVSLTDAKRIAREQGGELPSIKEFVIWLKDPQNFRKANRKFFWLREGPGLNFEGPCRIDYKNGAIEPMKDKNEWLALPDMEKAWAYPGNGPLQLGVGFQSELLRLGLYGNNPPDDLAHMAYVDGITEKALPPSNEELLRGADAAEKAISGIRAISGDIWDVTILEGFVQMVRESAIKE
jgi:hypothetical protein